MLWPRLGCVPLLGFFSSPFSSSFVGEFPTFFVHCQYIYFSWLCTVFFLIHHKMLYIWFCKLQNDIFLNSWHKFLKCVLLIMMLYTKSVKNLMYFCSFWNKMLTQYKLMVWSEYCVFCWCFHCYTSRSSVRLQWRIKPYIQRQ